MEIVIAIIVIVAVLLYESGCALRRTLGMGSANSTNDGQAGEADTD